MNEKLRHNTRVLCLVVVVGLSAGISPASVEILPVPYECQSDTGWCGVCSLAMLVNYYGVTPTQHKWSIASRLNLGHGDGIHPSTENLRAVLDILYPSLNDNADIRAWSPSINPFYEVLINYLRDKIDRGNAVFLGISCISFGHVVVVVGIDYNSENVRESILYVNDPSGALFEELGIDIPPTCVKASISCEKLYALWNCVTIPGRIPITTIAFHDLAPHPPRGLLDLDTNYISMAKIDESSDAQCYLEKGIRWARTYPDGSVEYSDGIFDPEHFLQFVCNVYNSTGYLQDYLLTVTVQELFVDDPYSEVVGEKELLGISDSSVKKELVGIPQVSLSRFLPSAEGKWYDLQVMLKDSEGEVLDEFDQWLAFRIKGEPPTIVDAEIAPGICDYGDNLTLQYDIESHFAGDVNVWLDATIRKNDNPSLKFSDDAANDTPIILHPGVNPYSRQFTIPANTPYGLYDVEFRIRSGREPGKGMTQAILWKEGILTLSSHARQLYIDSIEMKDIFGSSKTDWGSDEQGTVEVRVKNLAGQNVEGATVSCSVKAKATGITLAGYPKVCTESTTVGGLYLDRAFFAPANSGFTPQEYVLEVTATYGSAEQAFSRMEFTVNPRLQGHDVRLYGYIWVNPAIDTGDIQIEVGEYLIVKQGVKNEGIYTEDNVTVWMEILGTDKREEWPFTNQNLAPGATLTMPTTQLPTDGLAPGFYEVQCGATVIGDSDPSNNTKRWTIYIGHKNVDGDQIPLRSYRLFGRDTGLVRDDSVTEVQGPYTITIKYIKNGEGICSIKKNETPLVPKTVVTPNIYSFDQNDLVIYVSNIATGGGTYYNFSFEYGIYETSFNQTKPDQIAFRYVPPIKKPVAATTPQRYRADYDFYLPVGTQTGSAYLVPYIPKIKFVDLSNHFRNWSPYDTVGLYPEQHLYGGSVYFTDSFTSTGTKPDYYVVVPGPTIPSGEYNFLIFQHRSSTLPSNERGWLHSVRLIVQDFHDLAVTEVHVPDVVVVGEKPEINVTVSNKGDVSETNYIVTVEVDTLEGGHVGVLTKTIESPVSPIVFDSWDTSSLQPDKDYIITARVNLSTDMDSGNDSQQTTCHLSSPPPLMVSASANETSFQQRESVIVVTDVKDPTSVSVTGASVTCTVMDSSGQERTRSLQEEQPGRYSVTLLAPDSVGEFTVVVRASKTGFTDGASTPLAFTCVDVAPDTFFVPPTPYDGATLETRRAEVAWSGIDITTPTNDLQYAYKIDDESWADYSPATGIVLNLTGGGHIVQVKAKDGNGNEDPSAAEVSFFVSSFSVSGTVKDDLGIPIFLAVVTAGGKSTTTDPNGVYTLSGLAPGTYTLTAEKVGYSFEGRGITLSDSDLQDVDVVGDFVGYTISGRVVDNGWNGVFEVTVKFFDGMGTTIATAITNTGGYYGIGGLLAGSYELIPAKPGRGFSPSPTIVVVPPNRSAIDFEMVSAVIYVDNDVTGTGDGSSWADAYRCLQDALVVAWPRDEIRVAEGIYRPDQGAGITCGDRAATFSLRTGVKLVGGFAGFGEANPNTHDVSIYQTVLSGDLNGDDGPDFVNNGENSYHVVTGTGAGETAIMDGFTITSGNANGGGVNDLGSGMYNVNSRPTLVDCTFADNSAKEGGAMYNSNSNPKLTGCFFLRNKANGSSGGGLRGVSNSSPVVANCIFAYNNASLYGGAVSNDDDMTFVNCTFYANSADRGGGGVSAHGTLVNCILWGNTPNQKDGPVMFYYSNVQGGVSGTTNIDGDPCFADPDSGDFHLKSEAGRWKPSLYADTDLVADDHINLLDFAVFASFWHKHGGSITADFDDDGLVDLSDLMLFTGKYVKGSTFGAWIFDDVTSPCIDVGDPNSDWTGELWPHGKRINMGACGGTPEASMSLSKVGNVANLNNDAGDSVTVDDLALLFDKWCRQEPLLVEDLNRDGVVNFMDFAMFAQNWLCSEP